MKILLKVKNFKKKLGLNFKIINDNKSKIIGVFDPIGMPSVYLVKNGKIVGTIIGAKPHIDTHLLKILKALK